MVVVVVVVMWLWFVVGGWVVPALVPLDMWCWGVEG